MDSNDSGVARGVFIGRFNIETFIVAPGTGVAPVVHDQKPFPDANTNPATPPVHTFHLGLWFNSPQDAAAAGCPNGVTPFNGDHTAGIQNPFDAELRRHRAAEPAHALSKSSKPFEQLQFMRCSALRWPSIGSNAASVSLAEANVLLGLGRGSVS